jgi:hypothetical protein
MTRRSLAAYAGAVVVIAWAVLTTWAFIRGATRREYDVPYAEPEDGIQPGDTHTYALMDGFTWTYTGHD